MSTAVPPPSLAAPIIEHAPLPMVEVQGREHVVTHVNSAFCLLMGKVRAAMVGQRMGDIVPGGNACLPLLDQVYATGQAVTTAVADEEDGPTSWLYAMWPALDPDERPRGVIIGVTKITGGRASLTNVNEALLLAGLREQATKQEVEQTNRQLHDEIAERERVEQELRDANARLAEADRYKDQFLAMLAHELRNPLAPIKNAAQILRLANSPDATIVRAQAIIERQADHLAKLVDELLDVSRLQKGKVKLDTVPLELAKAVARALETCEPLIEAQRHTITVESAPGPRLYIEADPTRIDQVLVNLISNAAKYTRSGGTIRVRLARAGEMAVVRIRDSGIGLAPDSLRRVFDPFTQIEQSLERSQGGLGLGLNLVKELVELHGGQVEATSEGLEQGSEFVVRLPALEAATATPVVEAAAAVVVGPPKLILVVDDNPDSRDTMEMLLAMDGHRVELAEDGEQAVEKALHGRHDVAFVDIGLPKLNGYRVAEEIRRQPRGNAIVLIALSGYGQEEDKRKALEAGFDAHVTKPARLAVIRELLGDLERFARSS